MLRRLWPLSDTGPSMHNREPLDFQPEQRMCGPLKYGRRRMHPEAIGTARRSFLAACASIRHRRSASRPKLGSGSLEKMVAHQ